MNLPPVVQKFLLDIENYEKNLDKAMAHLQTATVRMAQIGRAGLQTIGTSFVAMGQLAGQGFVSGFKAVMNTDFGMAVKAMFNMTMAPFRTQFFQDMMFGAKQYFGNLMTIGAMGIAPFTWAAKRFGPGAASAAFSAGSFLVNNRVTRAAGRAALYGAGVAARVGGRAAGVGLGLGRKLLGGTVRRIRGMASFGLKAGMVAVPALMATVSFAAVKLAADLQQTRTAFEVMTGSGAAAGKMLADINKVAVQSPFTIRELREQAKALMAFGLGNKEVVPVMRMLGDVSAATGTSMERIVLAYGQVRAQGRLMGPELRQFTDAGIPILDYLAKVKNRPKIAIRGMVTEGLVSDADTHEAFMKMTEKGGVFYNMMARQAMTVKGQFSNLQDYAQTALEKVGESFFKGFGVSDLLDRVAQAIQGVTGMDTSKLESGFGRLREIFDVIMTAVQAIGEVIQDQMVKGLESFGGSMNWEDWKGTAVAAIKAVVEAIGLIADGIREALLVAMGMIEQIGQSLVDSGFIKGKGGKMTPYEYYRGAGHSKWTSFWGSVTDSVIGADSPNKHLFGEVDLDGTSSAKNPLAGITDKARKAFSGSFGGLFNPVFERLLAADAAKPAVSKEDKEARRMEEVDAKIRRMREEYEVQALPRGISQQAMELAGKTYGDMMHGKGSPLGTFMKQMTAFEAIANYREAGSGMRFFGDRTDDAVRFGQVAAFKQLASEVGQRQYQPLSGAEAGSAAEGVIAARSAEQSKDMLTEIRNTLDLAFELQKRQAEYDEAVAQVLTEGGFGVVGGRVD